MCKGFDGIALEASREHFGDSKNVLYVHCSVGYAPVYILKTYQTVH